MQDFECFCGDRFETREGLIRHNVDAHQMEPEESRRSVLEKYPAT